MFAFLRGIKISKTLGRILMGVAIIAALLLILQVRSCLQARQQEAQDRVDKGQDDATVNSARDAIETQGNVASNAQKSEDLTDDNTDSIRNAAGANDNVNAGVRDEGFAALCRRESFRRNNAARCAQNQR